MKNLTWQNPEQLFVAQELINKVKSKCCGIKGDTIVNVYPLINWAHRGIEKGEYYLFLIYKNNDSSDSIFNDPVISNKVKLIIK